MSKDTNVPRIRFKGFTNAWERHRVGDIGKIIMGQSPNSKNYTTDSSYYVLVQGKADIKNNKICPRVWTKQVTKLAKTNDILFTVRAPVGEVYKASLDVVIGRGMASIKANNFIFQRLKLLNQTNYWSRISSGSTFESISSKELENTEIKITTIKEQKEISYLLESVDILLTLQERKLKLYKQLKKYLLQKMFANEQEKAPQIRFKGFEEDWKKKKLGEIMEVSSVKRVHQSDWTNKGVRFFRARDIVSISKHIEPSEKIYIPFELYNKLSKISGKVKLGDLIVTGVGSIGIPLLIRDTNPIYFKDGNIIWFKNSGKIFGEFFYYSFIGNSIQKYIHISSGSGTVVTYTINSGKITPIRLPKYEEQVKVGSTLKRINENINFNMNKNKFFKQLKQYLLQNLFC
ncbi:restriction endonuclease subunit S [Lactobacillus sp. ESL0785]|uniref:restriction endonuclease subunit S n=1 Tax=Lactobacillus sp. ESL0785 TaxID=2983232 RepID=UPI0023F6FEEB|nr:restriction endonuclease subunit S [Lactobacillus sp. ESL0785]WEV70372.1 restriction endonuclease subunit S [Lactobacillus sp. ESL0785]